MINTNSNKKFVICITDAFTKYSVVTAIVSKDAETMAKAIYRDWFSEFGIPAQIHMESGKEFVNKLSEEFFQLLNVSHTKTSPAHPQCNAQVEVFNKTVKKFLQSFIDDTTLNWETFLPAITLAITPRLQLLHSSYFLEKKPDCRPSQMKIFNKYTTAKLQWPKDLTFCKN